MTDLIILATLLPGAKHGYQIKTEASWILGQQTLHNNLVYPLLRRFKKEGWVTKKTVPGERGQKRHDYALTATGRKTLIEKLTAFDEEDARSREGFLTRVGLFQILDADSRERILSAREKHLGHQEEHLAAIPRRFPLDRYPKETVKFLRQAGQAELRWIQHLRKIAKQSD